MLVTSVESLYFLSISVACAVCDSQRIGPRILIKSCAESYSCNTGNFEPLISSECDNISIVASSKFAIQNAVPKESSCEEGAERGYRCSPTLAHRKGVLAAQLW